jgi:hypothetical protein
MRNNTLFYGERQGKSDGRSLHNMRLKTIDVLSGFCRIEISCAKCARIGKVFIIFFDNKFKLLQFPYIFVESVYR